MIMGIMGIMIYLGSFFTNGVKFHLHEYPSVRATTLSTSFEDTLNFILRLCTQIREKKHTKWKPHKVTYLKFHAEKVGD